uniref:Uncharacterized protein n=1 Tax=Panagrolaimus davidi TaxID=227884 RepID=A0A914PN44_9BILA
MVDKVLPGNEKTIEKLELLQNSIYHIENGTFDKFTALKELDLSYNNLKNITSEVFTKKLGSTLQKLKIVNGAFDSVLVLDFSNLFQLKELWLSENQNFGKNNSFTKYIFPKALGNLTHLDLRHCGITSFGEDTFINLRSLETLLISYNPLISFPTQIYVLENLKYLSLHYTNIQILNNTGLNFTSNLEKLHITSTPLTMIDDCAFCGFPNLKELLLYKNSHLSYIHENAFGYAYNATSPPLETFSLEFCNLSTIPEDLLNWNNISKFALGRNPFFCNCSMAWLINDLLSPTHSVNLTNIVPKLYRYSWQIPIVDYQCYEKPAKFYQNS